MDKLNCNITNNGWVYVLTFEDGITKVGKRFEAKALLDLLN